MQISAYSLAKPSSLIKSPGRLCLLLDNDMNVCYRRSICLKGYDYAQDGFYFVTICMHRQDSLLGEIVDGEMVLGSYGEVARTCFEEIPYHFAHAEVDAFVVMPNHLHGIIVITHGTDVEAQHAVSLPIHRSDTQLLPFRLDVRQHAIHSLDIIRLDVEQALPSPSGHGFKP